MARLIVTLLCLVAFPIQAQTPENLPSMYPKESRELKEEGTVQVKVLVSSEGLPVKIEITDSSGFSRLDEAALESVSKWRFIPAKRGGHPVEAWVIVPIQFKLRPNVPAEKRCSPPHCAESPAARLNPGSSLRTGQSNSRSSEALDGEFDPVKALALLYGDLEPDGKHVRWKIQGTTEDIESQEFAEGSDVLVGVHLAQPYREGSEDKVMLITTAVPANEDFSCHACFPLLGGAVFVRHGGRWKMEAVNRLIGAKGGDHGGGTAPEGKLQQIGPDRFGVLFKSLDMWSGNAATFAFLVAATGDKVGILFDIESGYVYTNDCSAEMDRQGGCTHEADGSSYGNWGHDSTIEFLPGKNPDYYDLSIRYEGKRFDFEADKMETVDRVEIYRFSKAEGKYKRADGSHDI